MIHQNKVKVLEYIDGLLRAHNEAGMAINVGHIHTIRLMLCDAPNVERNSMPLDIGLATEPASNAAKRLLKA